MGQRRQRESQRESQPAAIYQIRIDLEGIRPPIWRRLLVPDNITLAQLSKIIIEAMGWYGYHLHEFEIDGISYGEPSPDYFVEMLDESKVSLRDIIPGPDFKFRYTYDFGNDWRHRIKVEKVLEPEPGMTYPVCVKGKRACPPEDVGGIWGYMEFLETIANPDAPEHDEMLEWVGGDFDPEAFDLDGINNRLRHLR